ncbi:hypothetical protein AgCh_034541 [Apium graveolens]
MRERSLLLSYYLAVSSLFEPEFSNQRIAWAKTAALVETVRSYFANIEKSCELRKAFIHDFNNTSENSIYANHGRYSVGKKLLGTLVEALKQLMLDVENALGKDIYPQLHQAGTNAIKKNRRTILTQEYEHFDSKADESLTDLYDKFIKLLNDLSLVDKEYDLEDSNLKFLLALPESWDLKSTTIRDNYALDETTLDEIYGMLETYEFEMDQRSKRHGRKSRTVALKAEEESPIVCSYGEGYHKDSLQEIQKGKEVFQERGHISLECKKGKSDKGKALVTKKKSWTYSSDFEDEVNCALMANADGSPETAELKVPQTTNVFYTDDITELRLYLKPMFISYRDQTLTCERLKYENLAYKKRNDYLEKELVMFHQTQKERDDVFYVRDELLKLNQSLKTELEKEREIIRTWTNSGRTTQNLLSSGNWKEGLGYGDDKSEKGTEQIKPIVVKQTAKPKVNPVKFVAKTVKSDSEKMKESVTEVKEKSTSDKLEQDKPAEVNIGLMTKKQLKHKLKEIRNANKVKAARKNRNGKKGVNKSNNYMPIPNAPRNKCYNCGNSNHLASFCRKNKNINSLPPKSGVKSQSVSVKSDAKSDISSDKQHVSINSDIKSAANANKLKKAKGSKQVWVLKNNH